MAASLRGGAFASLAIMSILFVAQPMAALDSAECTPLASGVPAAQHSLMQTARKGPRITWGRGVELSEERALPQVGLGLGLPDWLQNVTSPSDMDSAVRNAIRNGKAPMIQQLSGMIAGTIQWAQTQMLESASADKAKGDEILDAAHAQMTTCASSLNEVAALAANESYQAAGAAHRQCRQAESELFVMNQGLIAELGITVSAEDKECAGLDELSRANASKVGQLGESPDDVEETRKAHVLQEELSLKKGRCEDAQHATSDRQEALSAAQSELARRGNECDIAQDKLELAACALCAEVQGQCSNYTRCYAASKDTYNVLRTTHKEWVDGRKAEWTLSRQLECVVELLGKGVVSLDANDEEWLFEGCKASHQDDFPLEIGLPTRDAPVAEACGIVGDLYPCTEAYILKEYSGLPKDAPARACTPCSPVFPSQEGTSDASQQQLQAPASPIAIEVAPASKPSNISTSDGDAAASATARAGNESMDNASALDGQADSATSNGASESGDGAHGGNVPALDGPADSATSNGTSPRNLTDANSTRPAVDNDTVTPADNNTVMPANGTVFDAEDGLQMDDAKGLIQASRWADGLFDAEEDEED